LQYRRLGKNGLQNLGQGTLHVQECAGENRPAFDEFGGKAAWASPSGCA
jgi:hypothetical protein